MSASESTALAQVESDTEKPNPKRDQVRTGVYAKRDGSIAARRLRGRLYGIIRHVKQLNPNIEHRDFLSLKIYARAENVAATLYRELWNEEGKPKLLNELGEPRRVLADFLKANSAALHALDRLGLTPASRAQLGLDHAKHTDLFGSLVNASDARAAETIEPEASAPIASDNGASQTLSDKKTEQTSGE